MLEVGVAEGCRGLQGVQGAGVWDGEGVFTITTEHVSH